MISRDGTNRWLTHVFNNATGVRMCFHGYLNGPTEYKAGGDCNLEQTVRQPLLQAACVLNQPPAASLESWWQIGLLQFYLKRKKKKIGPFPYD